jgi:hypothetical protein
MSKKNAVTPKTPEWVKKLAWKSPKHAPFQIAGLAWWDAEHTYRRLPVKPADKLPQAVDGLAWNTSGAQIRFETDSTTVAVQVKLPQPHNMHQMTATGQCGFDAYFGPLGRMHYSGTPRYDRALDHYEAVLFEVAAPRKRRAITLNFPLYSGVTDVRVGLDRGARVWNPKPFCGRAVVYGTSITQGGCASRPGMNWTNIASRRLGLEFINLGFSGSGKGEPEVARRVAEVPRVNLFIIENEANCPSLEHIQQTLPEFIRILRAKHPKTPILVVSRIPFASDLRSANSRRKARENRAFQHRTVMQLRAAGDRHIFFLDGSKLLGRDFDECAVDGVHPTDLGFYRIAGGMIPAIKRTLKRKP